MCFVCLFAGEQEGFLFASAAVFPMQFDGYAFLKVLLWKWDAESCETHFYDVSPYWFAVV